jgi:hypothetical protein
MIRSATMILATLIALTGPMAQAQTQPQASGAKCKIGRPAYCFKYSGTLCEQSNTTNAVGACAAWGNACLQCHEATAACLGNRVRLRSEPICSRCDAAWSACMRKIDSRYWPNRQRQS